MRSSSDRGEAICSTGADAWAATRRGTRTSGMSSRKTMLSPMDKLLIADFLALAEAQVSQQTYAGMSPMVSSVSRGSAHVVVSRLVVRTLRMTRGSCPSTAPRLRSSSGLTNSKAPCEYIRRPASRTTSAARLSNSIYAPTVPSSASLPPTILSSCSTYKYQAILQHSFPQVLCTLRSRRRGRPSSHCRDAQTGIDVRDLQDL